MEFVTHLLADNRFHHQANVTFKGNSAVVQNIALAIQNYASKMPDSSVVLYGQFARIGLDDCLLSYATQGHTGVDVNLYAFGAMGMPKDERDSWLSLSGAVKNFWLGKYIASVFGLDLNQMTSVIRSEMESWEKMADT